MPVNNLTYSANGLALTEKSEGFVPTAYQDPVGVWTIGYGHTGPDVTPGLTITLAQAQQLLQQDTVSAASCVNNCVTVVLNQNQFDALVDFTFNLGPKALYSSTLLKDVNLGDFDSAAQQFGRWVYAGGKVLPGLVTRRAAEAALFQT